MTVFGELGPIGRIEAITGSGTRREMLQHTSHWAFGLWREAVGLQLRASDFNGVTERTRNAKLYIEAVVEDSRIVVVRGDATDLNECQVGDLLWAVPVQTPGSPEDIAEKVAWAREAHARCTEAVRKLSAAKHAAEQAELDYANARATYDHTAAALSSAVRRETYSVGSKPWRPAFAKEQAP